MNQFGRMHSMLIVPVTSGKENVGCGNGDFKEHFPFSKVLEYLTAKMYVCLLVNKSDEKPPNHSSTEGWIQTMGHYILCKMNTLQLHVSSFPGGWAGEGSNCKGGDLHLIPGLRGSPGGGNGYSLQYSWRIPWTAWSMGSQRVGYNWETFTCIIIAKSQKQWWEKKATEISVRYDAIYINFESINNTICYLWIYMVLT